MDEALRRSAAHVLVDDVDRARRRRRRPPTTSAGCCACATARSSRSPTAPVGGAPAGWPVTPCEPTATSSRRRRPPPTVTVAVAPPKGDRARVAGPEVHRGRRRPHRPARRRAVGRALGRRPGGRASWSACGGSPPRPRCSRAGCGCRRSRGPVAGDRRAADGGGRRAGWAGRRVPPTRRSPSVPRAVGRRPSWRVAGDRWRSGRQRAARRDGGRRRRDADGGAPAGRTRDGRADRSGSTCTCRSARRGATTARSPPGPTGPT